MDDEDDTYLPPGQPGLKRWRSPSLDEAMEQMLRPFPDTVSLTDLGGSTDVEKNWHYDENDYKSHRRVSLHYHQPLHKLHQKHKRHSHKSDHDLKQLRNSHPQDESIPEESNNHLSKPESEDVPKIESPEQEDRPTFYVGSEPSIEKASLPTPKKIFSGKLSSAFHSVKSPLKVSFWKPKGKSPSPSVVVRLASMHKKSNSKIVRPTPQVTELAELPFQPVMITKCLPGKTLLGGQDPDFSFFVMQRLSVKTNDLPSSPSPSMPSTSECESEDPLLPKSVSDSSSLKLTPIADRLPEDKPHEFPAERLKVSFACGADTTDEPKKIVVPPLKKTHHKSKKPHGQEQVSKRLHQGEANEPYKDIIEPEEAELLQVYDIEGIASHRVEIPKFVRHNKIHEKNSSVPSQLDKRNGSDVTSLLKKKEIDHTPHEIFVELNELLPDELTGQLIWKETARWIKYEEDIELGGGRWGKPHVSSLSFHSLLQLNYYLMSGSVILDLEKTEYIDIAEAISMELVKTDQLKSEQQKIVLANLLLRHRHTNERSGSSFLRRSSAVNFNASGQEKRPQRNHTENDFGHHSISHRLPRASVPETSILIPNSLPVDMAKHEENIKSTILHRVPADAEGVMVLVGAIDFLERPALAFVRLGKGETIPNLLEIPIPVRFFFLFLGPHDMPDLDYHEIGRSMSTLMSNRNFHDAVYRAKDRGDMIHAFNYFLDESIVMPPGDLQKSSLVSAEIRRKSVQLKKKEIPSVIKEEAIKPPYDPLKRTHRLFGGFLNDAKNRYPWYASDIKDGFNMQCVAATIFIYFAAVSGAIAFGGLLGDKTGDLIGVPETLITTCVSGVVFSLLACQPLVVLGTTGPVLLFDEILFQFSKNNSMDFLRLRVWVGFWTAIIATVLVAFDGSSLVRFFSRFMQEIFATIISMLFIYESILKLHQVFVENPLQSEYKYPLQSSNFSNSSYFNETIVKPPSVPRPNTALLSLLLTIGTFYIALFLRHFRNSKFLGRSARRALGDFGVPIAIAIMVGLDFSVTDVYTQKLNVPSGLSPSDPSARWWFISPLPITPLEILTSCIAGFLFFILLFLETQICELIVSKKERKTIKGSGFHFDMMLISYLSIATSIIGGPWVCAATVRTISHVSSLTVLSKTHAPGETPHIVEVKEQRVTNLCVSMLIGISVLMAPLLQKVPVAVLFGVFLYMGISALSGIQLYERFLLMFIPNKHHPDVPFVTMVPTLRMHMYTMIQIICIGVLWGIKSVSMLAPGFPFGLLALVLIRAQVKRLFTPEEFKALDGEETDDKDDEPDFYEQIVA